MNACIQLYAQCDESREKREMGFELSEWDDRLLKYGDMFEDKIMNLNLNIELFDALDECWEILAECFQPEETGIRSTIIDKHWPKKSTQKEPEKVPEPVQV
jgi:V/A-type H+-transporting ATPase subunit B